MSKTPEIDVAITRGLTFLATQQETDGSFISFSSASPRPFRRLRSWQTTFVPALMLASLSGLDEPAALVIRGGLADFLLKQKDKNGAFNYWARSAPEYRSEPYPNDLDDTFCALAALKLHDASLVDEAVLASAVKLLLAAETAVGGPYRTWLVSPESAPIWLDVDMAVNSNIAYFLSLTGNRLPSLDSLMGKAITENAFSSPYYPFEPAFIYYFARAYEGPEQARLRRKARQLQTAATTSLDRALCLSASLRLTDRRNLREVVATLVSEQRPDGSWPAAALYADPVKNGKLYYNGGAALTTAFALEALQLYKTSSITTEPARSKSAKTDYPAHKTSVLALARKRNRNLPVELRRTVSQSLVKLAHSDNGKEIIGLPPDFSRSLKQSTEPWSDTFLTELGLANLYGWAAYTIYDDFLDDEGHPNLLPTANVAMRESLSGFLGALPDSENFQRLVREVFNTIDGANAWEVTHCRYKVRDDKIIVSTLPDYGDRSKLAERSFGHTLAPLAVLSKADVSDAAMRYSREALAQYLIAKQLNDDLHDWQEDLSNGHITYVVARILSGLRVGRGSHSLSALQTRAQTRFWHMTLPAVCGEMRQHVAKGRRALRLAGIFTDDAIIVKLLDSLEASIEDTLAQQREAENFLKHYRQKTKV